MERSIIELIMDAMSAPRRAVVGGIGKLAGVDGAQSVTDLLRAAGMGEGMSQGLGFAGDIAADPFTWLPGVLGIKGAMAGRAAAAQAGRYNSSAVALEQAAQRVAVLKADAAEKAYAATIARLTKPKPNPAIMDYVAGQNFTPAWAAAYGPEPGMGPLRDAIAKASRSNTVGSKVFEKSLADELIGQGLATGTPVSGPLYDAMPTIYRDVKTRFNKLPPWMAPQTGAGRGSYMGWAEGNPEALSAATMPGSRFRGQMGNMAGMDWLEPFVMEAGVNPRLAMQVSAPVTARGMRAAEMTSAKAAAGVPMPYAGDVVSGLPAAVADMRANAAPEMLRAMAGQAMNVPTNPYADALYNMGIVGSMTNTGMGFGNRLGAY